jgi:hypothetical protein
MRHSHLPLARQLAARTCFPTMCRFSNLDPEQIPDADLRMANSYPSGDRRPGKGIGNAPAIDQACHRQDDARQMFF